MNQRTIAALLCTIVFAATGCHHKPVTAPQASVPAAPAISPVMVSVPPPSHHDQSQVVVQPVPSPSTPVEPVRHTGRAPRKTPTNTAAAVPAPSTPQVASEGKSIELGKLTTGGESSTGFKQETADLLKAQQQRLAAISQTSAAAHPTEIAQVKAFLQKAASSWEAADYEGAHTLVIKAKVLLDDFRR